MNDKHEVPALHAKQIMQSPVTNQGQLGLDSLDCRDTLEMVAGYTLILGTDRRIRWLNRAPIGHTPEHYQNRDFLDFVAEAQRPLVRDAFERAASGDSAIEIELQGAEDQLWYLARLSAIIKRGTVQGVFVHVLDIDDAKRVQTELAIQRARLRPPEDQAPSSAVTAQLDHRRFELLADALPVLISYVDADRRYQYNNAAYERWFGVSREALRGRELDQVLGEAAYREIRPYVDATLSGSAVRFEMAIPYKDAGLRRVVARYMPDINEHGEVVGFFALIEDVSAQREAEAAHCRRAEQMRQLQKMEALGRLAGGIAHEFGNLLMTITMGCTAVAELVEPGTPLAKMVAQVKRAAQRGESLTRQLRSFSRAGELELGPLAVDALVGDLAMLLERLLESRIELEVELGANARIVADAGQIQQILMNLAINARDAMPEGGRLRLETSLVNLTPEQASAHQGLGPRAYVLMAVTDTGVGMDAATRARLFEPFFTTKPPGAGTGLGLSTVYGIVRSAGGHIEVESAPGQGTSFRLYFPTCA